jgi:ribosome-associated protein
MSRKPKKGYFVRGEFVALGSARDEELKTERQGTQALSRTARKQKSTELQVLGEKLLTLHPERIAPLNLNEALREALAKAKLISDFEGKRRQLQYIGKLMRVSDPALPDAIRAALAEQHSPLAQDHALLQASLSWRTDLLASDDHLQRWLSHCPHTDAQHLRALIRKARKEAAPASGATERRAYRAIFQLVHEQLKQHPQPPIAP